MVDPSRPDITSDQISDDVAPPRPDAGPAYAATDQPMSRGPSMPRGARIEGGRGAIIVGAGINGLVAATRLAIGGMDVVLIENGEGLAGDDRRGIGVGFAQDLDDVPMRRLSADMVKRLRLSRRGFAYADRRLHTVYVRPNLGIWRSDGDLSQLATMECLSHSAADAATPTLPDADQRRRCAGFLERVMAAAGDLDAILNGAIPEAGRHGAAPLAERLFTSSLASIFADEGVEPPFCDLLAAEAILEAVVRPDAPLSAGALALRFGGGSLGRRTALSFPAGGVRGIFDSLRRAAQAAGVDIRSGARVARVIVEGDRVQGVVLADGGQIRAPIVVDAGEAGEAFASRIGHGLLDVEFSSRIERAGTLFGTARVAIALASSAPLPDAAPRYLVAPSLRHLTNAFSLQSDAGRAVELLFTHRRIEDAARGGGATAILRIAPIERPEAPAELRSGVERIVRKALDQISAGLSAHLVAIEADWVEPVPAPLRAVARVAALKVGTQISGHFYCGPGAQVGDGPDGAPGMHAADAALALWKESR